MTDYIKEFNKSLRYIYLLAAIVLIVFFIYKDIKYETISLRYKFNGIIENVVYDDKGQPSIMIKGKTYDLLSNWWNFNHLVEKGDSIKKDSGDRTVKLIKHKNGKVFIFGEK